MQNRNSPGACVKANRVSDGRTGAVATSRQMQNDVNWENTHSSGTYKDKVGGRGSVKEASRWTLPAPGARTPI